MEATWGIDGSLRPGWLTSASGLSPDTEYTTTVQWYSSLALGQLARLCQAGGAQALSIVGSLCSRSFLRYVLMLTSQAYLP